MRSNNTKKTPFGPKFREKTDSSSPLTVHGIIIPVEWDDHGGVTSLSILTRDEDEYFVLWDERGKALLSMIREEVEVTGRLQFVENKKIVAVMHFRKRGGPGG